MLLSLRSTAFQLCLLMFALVAVVAWYRDHIEETTRLWYERARSRNLANGRNEHSKAPHADSQDHVRMSHTVRPDGLLETNMEGRHPLWDLFADAERKWEDMNARQSTTLAQAVAEYTKRNGYPPPAGFDQWWKFVQKHHVKLVDEFDQINYDITPYLALSPSKFRERVDELDQPDVAFHVNVTNGHTRIYGPHWLGGNQRQVASIMMDFSRALPDMVVHGHDDLHADLWIGEDLRHAAEEKARVGQYFTEEELQHFESLERNPHTDRKSVCMPDDPVFGATRASNIPTFIASHLTSMSPCLNSLMLKSPPVLFAPNARIPRLIPRLVFSKHRPDSGLLIPTNLWDFYDPLLIFPHTWDERHEEGSEKLFWQGPSTGWNWYKGVGGHDSGLTWRDGARPKFALDFSPNATQGQMVEVLIENANDRRLEMKTFDRAFLNEKWMDVGLTGSPIQCQQEDGTCEEMRQAPMWKELYPARKRNRKKFVADLDSNEWSSEFQKKLSWGNVVFKATTYPEWNTQWLIPYYHYIPIQTDYSDVYNIMAFFLGDPETGMGGHEDIAARISQRASSFVQENWRWEDMQAYFYRLILEYLRLGSDDREAASFRL